MSATFTRPAIGETYFAPCLTSATSAPLIFGERHGFIVDGKSQGVAVVYTSRELADAALADLDVWHPSTASRVTVRAVTFQGGRRFTWASSRHFDWEDGFTPYSATLDGDTLTEYAGGAVERRSTLSPRPEWDGHPNAADYAMSDAFSAGEVDGVAAVWIDGRGYSLAVTA